MSAIREGMSSILDDMKRLRAIDRSGMLSLQTNFPSMCEDAIKRAEELEIFYGKPERIVVAGMGGSGISGELLSDWLSDELPIPIYISRDYVLPAYVDDRSLFFAVSYSGNTEETLSSFVEAIKRRCMIVAISSGGQLVRYCEELNIPLIEIPLNIPPRAALPYLFFPIVIAMEKMELIQNKREEIRESIALLKKIRDEIKPEVLTCQNKAKEMALQLKDTIPIIYGFRHYSSIALRMKTQFNENSKIPAKCETFPELDHNEIVGWSGPEELTKRFSVILLRDVDEDAEIKTRIELTKALMEEKVSKVLELYGRGKSRLARMFSALYIGDFVSIYLAILYGVDPTPVEAITDLKAEMGRRLRTLEIIQREIRELVKD